MSKGRVYRRCYCRDDNGRELGVRCPLLLGDRKHGTWTFAVDVPSLDGHRKTMRRGGYPTKSAAQRTLSNVLARYGAGVKVDDRETVAGYLATWLDGKRHDLKPKTMYRYNEIITKELVPALGALPLEQLNHQHVAAFIAELEETGRGAPTIRYVHAVLSSALSDAVKQRRLVHNVAQHVALPPTRAAERVPWTAAQAAVFLDYAHRIDDRLADLFEVVIGTGLRRGEALALRWPVVDLAARVLFIQPGERCPILLGIWCLPRRRRKDRRPELAYPRGLWPR